MRQIQVVGLNAYLICNCIRVRQILTNTEKYRFRLIHC